MTDHMLRADLAVRLPNDLPGGATPQAATMDDVFDTTLADSDSPGDTLAEYAYLGLGRVVQEIYPEPEVRLDYDSGTPGEYVGFDRFGRVVDHLWYAYAASADRDRYTYGYDRASNRLYRENTLTTGRDELYGYDQVNRLIAFQRGELNATKDGITGTPVKAENWGLDTTGNWDAFLQKTSGTTDLDQGRTHNPVNEITAITATTGTDWADPEHDRNGNMTTIPKPASLADGLTATYDAWNRLVEVKDGQTVIARYDYDGLNRRIKSHIDRGAPSNPNGIDTHVHYYHNYAWQIIETRQSDTQSAAPETLQPKHQYVWSQRYIDATILRDENTGTNGLCDDERLYYLNDANFNVTALLDTAGDAVERYVYSPYGVVTIYDPTWTNTRSASTYANVTLYTGRELDVQTGLYYYRNRYYGAELGRFVSRDPIGYEGGDGNLYAYCGDASTIWLDPTGTEKIANPCGVFHWKDYSEADRPGWELDFDPKGCPPCAGEIKLVQVFTGKGMFGTPPTFDARKPKERMGGALPLALSTTPTRQLPEGILYPGYIQSGYRGGTSKFHITGTIRDAPSTDLARAGYFITVCAVCELSPGRECLLGCINFESSGTGFSLMTPNRVLPCRDGMTVKGTEPYEAYWRRAKEWWAAEKTQKLYYPGRQ